MDKNTLWGLVLMGAIMFGFLYLSKPSEAEIAAERERSEQARAQTESKNTPTVVPFTAADSSALAGAVRAMGKQPTMPSLSPTIISTSASTTRTDLAAPSAQEVPKPTFATSSPTKPHSRQHRAPRQRRQYAHLSTMP